MAFDKTKTNTKFGLLALDDCKDLAFEDTVELGEGVSIHSTCPIEVPGHWKEWLGTLETGHLQDADFLIAVQADSATPAVLDAETRAIDVRLNAHWYGLLLHGIPDYQGGVTVLGGVGAKSSLSVRQFHRVPTAYRHIFGKRLVIDTPTLASSNVCATTILDLHEKATFRRVRAGFKACIRVIEEFLAEERLHQYVRAIDGLMHIPKGPGEPVFAARGVTFAKGTDLDLILRQFYRMRNAQEHLNEFREALDAPDDDGLHHLGSRLAYQAEQLALSCYRRLFTTPALLATFESDASTDAFWKLDDAGRRALWGDPFDLDAVREEHDYRYKLLKGHV